MNCINNFVLFRAGMSRSAAKPLLDGGSGKVTTLCKNARICLSLYYL
jgi:hypothetical protein